MFTYVNQKINREPVCFDFITITMGRRNRSAGEAGQRQSGKKSGARGAFTLRNIAITGLAVVCGLFFLRPRSQRRPRAEEAPHHAELGSRRIAVRPST